jgi:hypothetical protein
MEEYLADKSIEKRNSPNQNVGGPNGVPVTPVID